MIKRSASSKSMKSALIAGSSQFFCHADMSLLLYNYNSRCSTLVYIKFSVHMSYLCNSFHSNKFRGWYRLAMFSWQILNIDTY